MKLRVGARTDVGRVRKGNEDSFTAKEPLFAVADGMGGHQGGEVASSLALEILGKGGGTLEELVRQANQAVYNKAAKDPGLAGMGTTLTALLADGEVLRLAHVGDSRAYLQRDGSLQRLTKDHTVVERLVDEGRLTAREAEVHPQRSILTRALGVEDELQVDQRAVEPRPGDRLLLCSDGLTGMIDEDEIGRILTEHTDPQSAADALVESANRAGGQDNITALVVDVVGIKKAAARQHTTEVAPPSASPSAAGRISTAAAGWARSALLRLLIVLVVIGGALWAVKALWVDNQFYVGEANGHVAVFRGIPAAPLGFELSRRIKEFPELPAAEVARFPEYQELAEGITAENEQQAGTIVAQMRAALDAAQAADDPTGQR